MGAGSEDGDTSPKAASSSSKTRRNTKKTLKSKSSDENEPKENSPKKSISIKLKKIDDQVDYVPLLDQNPVVEGSRNRKTINKLVIKEVPVSKRSRAIEIPNGRGRALGRITNACSRLKGLDDLMIKTLHRGLFGKAMGKTNDLLNNIMLFRGFEFKKDSDAYQEKLIDLSKKFTLHEMKSLIYTFDLEMNYKTKDEAVTCILDFLIDPQPSKNPKPALEGHPRRKATKRDYFEADIADEYSKRKKKRKKKTTDESEEDDSSKKKQSKKLKSNDIETEGEKDESETGDNESENEKDSESKKPAKKRKSNQIIDQSEEEGEGEEESLRNGGSPVSKTKKKERK